MVFKVDRRQKKAVVPGYGGRYEVGDLGRVYSRGCEMSLIDGRFVKLCEKGRVDRVDVAYLVARAFIPNQEGRMYIVHKDGDFRNNRVENLEWSEVRQRSGGRPVVKKRILQFDTDGRCVGVYGSVREAVEHSGVSRGVINRSIAGKRGRMRKFEFRYEG